MFNNSFHFEFLAALPNSPFEKLYSGILFFLVVIISCISELFCYFNHFPSFPKLTQFVKLVPLFNKLPAPLCNNAKLPYFVIMLPHFVKMLPQFVIKNGPYAKIYLNIDEFNKLYFLRIVTLTEFTSFSWDLKLGQLNYFKVTSFDINQFFILIMITCLSYISTDASQSTSVIYVLLVLEKVAVASLLRLLTVSKTLKN